MLGVPIGKLLPRASFGGQHYLSGSVSKETKEYSASCWTDHDRAQNL